MSVFALFYLARMMEVGDLNKKVGFVYSDACQKQRKLILLGTNRSKTLLHIKYLKFTGVVIAFSVKQNMFAQFKRGDVTTPLYHNTR